MTVSDRQLTFLAIVALLLVIVTAVLYGTGKTRAVDFEKGSLLIQGLEPDKVATITLKEKDKALTLARKGKGFVVVQSSNYPADTKKINELLIKCLDIRIADKVTHDPANHEKLGVKEGAKDATVVRFYGQAAAEETKKSTSKKGEKATEGPKPLVALVVGRSVARGTGNYVRLLDDDTVYASEKSLYLSTSPTSYMETEIVNVKKDDVQEVSVKLKDASYTIARGKDDKAVLQSIPKGKRAKQSEVDSVFDALSWVSFNDVLPVGKVDARWDATYTCRLKKDKHTTYIARLAKKGDKHYLQMAAQGPPRALIEKSRLITKDASKEELKKKDAIFTAADKAAAFTRKHAGWAYEVSSWKAEKMRKPLKDLIEDIPKPTEPTEISARHILIAYKGAQKASKKITRTKEEARKLAEKVLKEAKAKGADFAALARKYSDGPSKSKGGDLGSFKKGKMHKNFEAAAWKLEVNEISPVVETPFGFHIILRTK